MRNVNVFEGVRRQMEDLRRRNAKLELTVENLETRLAAVEANQPAKRGPGRPPKVVEAAE